MLYKYYFPNQHLIDHCNHCLQLIPLTVTMHYVNWMNVDTSLDIAVLSTIQKDLKKKNKNKFF